jgi:tetratricopeptide (TPR) repeat protein
MSRHQHVLTIAALFVLLASSSQAQTAMFRGTVLDSDRNPLPGVQVTVTSEDLASFRKSLTTDQKGQFRLRFQTTHLQYTFDFLFEKPGYASFTVPRSPSATQQMDEEFVMEVGETRVVESHGDLASVVSGSSSAAVEAFNAGLTAQLARDLATARARFEEALAADPNLGPAHVALSQVLLDQGEYGPAVEAADRALELAVSRADALRVKYQALRALGRNEDAEAIGAELEQVEGVVASARRVYNEGGQAFQAGDKETALAKFLEAAELDPSIVEAHHAIATLQLGKGDYAAAAAAAEKAIALGSEDINTLRILYDAYDALGRTEQLVEIAPRLAAVDPDYGGNKLLEQAAGLWNNGQTEAAVKLSRLALAIDSSLAKAHYFIGLDHLSRGENAEAKAALQKFVDMAPDDAEAGTAREMIAYIQ